MVEVFSNRQEKEYAVLEFINSGKRFLYIYGPAGSGKTYCVNKFLNGKSIYTIEDISNQFETITNKMIGNAEVVVFYSHSYNPILLQRYPGTTIMEFEGIEISN
jgi:AAA+ ATPase superfamily predicted ATPase